MTDFRWPIDQLFMASHYHGELWIAAKDYAAAEKMAKERMIELGLENYAITMIRRVADEVTIAEVLRDD